VKEKERKEGSDFWNPYWYLNSDCANKSTYFLATPFLCSFFASSSLFIFHRQSLCITNDSTSIERRTNGKSPLLTPSSSFAYHYQLFAFCIVPLSFDTRSATTVTTTIKTTTILMTTSPLPHVAQKGSFQNFQM
jgi:hypothetical protein